MKTHNYGSHLAILAAACSLAACTNSTPVPPAATEATAAAPASSAPAGPPTASGPAITPGKYRVCKVSAGAQDHLRNNTITGTHIAVDGEAEIGKIDPNTATLVCLDGACPTDPTDPEFKEKVLWMTGDAHGLKTVQEFAHTNKGNGSPVEPSPRHLVQLMVEPDEVEGCNENRKVLSLKFCEWSVSPPPEAAPAWVCFGPPHAGVVHLEDLSP